MTTLFTALFLFTLALQYGQMVAPSPVLAVHDEGLFELDGNATDGAAAGDDWNSTNNAEATVFIAGSKENAANDVTYFTTGGSKDVNDISQWKYTSNDVAPDKDQILDAYAAAYKHGGDTFVYFGADRFDGSGDSFVGFWFVQDKISLDGNGGFNGVHTDGDILVVSDFTNGGSVSEIKVYEWLNGGLSLKASGAQCDVGTDDACAVVNAVTTAAPWPFLNKSGASDFAAGEFYEGGINLDKVFGGDAPCFSSFIAETRSSQSTSAQLKDFALGSFNTCKPPTITTESSKSNVDFGGSVTDTATLSGSDGAASGSVKFFVCGPSASTPDCSTGGTQVGSAVAVTTSSNGGTATSAAYDVGVTAAASGKYCWRAEYTPNAASQYLAGEHTNTTTECFKVDPATISITKTANPVGPVNAGDEIGFDITVENKGTQTTLGVSVSDTLPAGITWAENSDLCSITAGVLTCTKASLAAGASFTVHVSGMTDAADCKTIENTAAVATSNDGTDSSKASVVVNCPDVSVVKTPNDGQVNADDPASFAMVVSNAGPGTAAGVSLSDPLPAGLTWALGTLTGNTDGVTCAVTGAVGSQVLSCSDSSMASGQSFTVTVTTTTSSALCAAYPNTATVDATNESNDPSVTDDNTDPGQITVNCPDVQAIKTADKSPVNAGDPIGFTVTIKNNGTGTAYGATGSDTLPAGIVWSIDGAANGWSIEAGVLSFGPTDLAGGASAAVHIVGPTSPAQCGIYPNTVTVDATNESNDPSVTDDNSATASITVNCPDVQAIKTADKSPVNAGDPIGFTVTIKNNGTGTAYGATGSDTLPAGIVWSIDGAANGWSIEAGVLSFGPTDLAGGASAAVHIVGTTDGADCGVVPNTVTVDATNESNLASFTDDNSDDASVTVNCPDLEVVKSGNGPISAGDKAVFTITVINHGPGVANDVTLSDQLPSSGWTLGGANATDCSISGSNLLTCDFGDVDAPVNSESNSIRTITLTRETEAVDCGTIPNTASAVASNEDTETDQYPNEDSASIVVDCPLIVITKTADKSPVNAGDQVGFTVTVTNNGAGTAFGVTVSDTLPTGMSWAISPVSAGWSINAGVLSFGPAALAGVGSAPANVTSVHVVATSDATDCGLVPNTAFLTYRGDEGDDDAEVQVNCPDVEVIKSGNGPIINGQTATFSITTTNHGPGDAYGVTLSDQLPAGAWTLGGADAEACSINSSNLLTCEFGTVDAPGEGSDSSRTITVSKTATTADCGTIPNEVTVGASNEDTETDEFPNTDDAAIEVRCPAIDIVKAANDDLVEPNQVVTFTLNVKVVQGPVTEAVVTDTLPIGQAYVTGSASPAPFSVSADGRTITWKYASLATGDPSATITYNVKVDANATGAKQVNVAQICVAEKSVTCDSDDEDITPQFPDILLVKTAGTAADGAAFATEPGPVTYTYIVTNTGPLALQDVTVTDDAGTPDNAGDDFAATCPKTTLAVDESMTCTFSRTVLVDTTNIAVARGVTAEGNPVEDDDPADVRILEHGLIIDKTNDAPIVKLDQGDGTTADLPTADEGDTVTYTLAYTFAGDPVTNGIITDVLPLGVTYVSGSATNDAQFTFQGYDAGTRTLTWTAPTVDESGTLTYKATVDVGAAEISQPLVNVATIKSDQSPADTDDSRVFVPGAVEEATGTPNVTLPPTDAIGTSKDSSNPGFGLMLTLLFLAAVVIVVGFVTPVPASARRRSRR